MLTAIILPNKIQEREGIPLPAGTAFKLRWSDRQRQNPDADGVFSNAPYFNWDDGKLKFDTNDVDNANDNYGSASGFLPKSLPLF